MNATDFKIASVEKEWIKIAGYFLAIVVLLLLVYVVFIVPQARRMNDERGRLSTMRALAQQYRDFKSFETKVNQQREEIRALVTGADLNSIVGSQTEKGVLDAISMLSRAASINIDRINPNQTEAGQVWDLSFVASFQQLVKFLPAVEKYFKIEELRILNEGTAPLRVSMLIIPVAVAPASEEGTATKGNIFDLFNVTDEIVKNVKQQLELRQDIPVTRDPFTGESLIMKAEPAKPKVVKRNPLDDMPRLAIDSISWDPETPIVIIDGRVLREGDTMKDVRIVKILEDSVTLEWRGYTHKARVTKKGE